MSTVIIPITPDQTPAHLAAQVESTQGFDRAQARVTAHERTLNPHPQYPSGDQAILAAAFFGG
jgi:hypothetical protein